MHVDEYRDFEPHARMPFSADKKKWLKFPFVISSMGKWSCLNEIIFDYMYLVFFRRVSTRKCLSRDIANLNEDVITEWVHEWPLYNIYTCMYINFLYILQCWLQAEDLSVNWGTIFSR
jgi:hypothetical protein